MSSYDYQGFLADPDAVAVPMQTTAPPLPDLVEPALMPPVTQPTRDDQPLVVPAHRRLRVLPVYWHLGWPAAQPESWVRVEVAKRLADVASALPAGFGLALLDGWRSLALQAEVYAAAYADPLLPPGFVAPPSEDPTTPPPHVTGGAVDLTLTWEHQPLALGSPFDDFTPTAHTGSFETTPGRVRQLRRLLFWAMHAQGFRVIDCEWWHFELGTRRWAALTGNDVWYARTQPS